MALAFNERTAPLSFGMSNHACIIADCARWLEAATLKSMANFSNRREFLTALSGVAAGASLPFELSVKRRRPR